MLAMLLEQLGAMTPDSKPLRPAEVPVPQPQADELLLKVRACAVCHTELDEIEGRTPPPRLPVVPGHQVVGVVERCGAAAGRFRPGDRVGVAWIFSACGECEQCRSGHENLCSEFLATGRDVNGGYADYMTVPEAFAHPIPDSLPDVHAAPLLCAGAIGYRSLALTGMQNGDSLGLTGFGASGHLVLKMVRYRFPASRVFVFARKPGGQACARELGAAWAGDTNAIPPQKLHAIIDTTPAWTPVVEALRHLRPGGRLVINAIRKEETDKSTLLALDYPTQLWEEKEIKSVANVTRADVAGMLALATQTSIEPAVETFSLREANAALCALKFHPVKGAKVLVMAG